MNEIDCEKFSTVKSSIEPQDNASCNELIDSESEMITLVQLLVPEDALEDEDDPSAKQNVSTK